MDFDLGRVKGNTVPERDPGKKLGRGTLSGMTDLSFCSLDTSTAAVVFGITVVAGAFGPTAPIGLQSRGCMVGK